MKNEVFWLSPDPKTCNICKEEIKDEFVDGKTVYRPWAIMCPECHKTYGVGLGTGRGQLYKKEEEGWRKIEG